MDAVWEKSLGSTTVDWRPLRANSLIISVHWVKMNSWLASAADTPELFAASGRAFGRFQQLLGDYPAASLHETIPHFHDTEDRLAKRKAAFAENHLAPLLAEARSLGISREELLNMIGERSI